ncbi:hypothetical protein IAT40_000969 [Kwoniella sp. CBS 6097]
MSEIPFHSSPSSEQVNTPFFIGSSSAKMAKATEENTSSSADLHHTSTMGVNLPFVNPTIIPPQAEHIKLERFTPSPPFLMTQLPSTPESHPNRHQADTNLMPPPPPVSITVSDPSSTSSLGKRKAQDEQYANAHQMTFRRKGSGFSRVKEESESAESVLSDIKPSIPIPILPIPLPSKRFKKRPTSKAVLIPVEQLPVFPLPPLPAIEDADLLKQVFTHQSLFERARGKFEDSIDNPTKHYEKLEHVGDAILGFVVTTWLHESRPRLTIGTATKLKAHLVSNATLSHLSGLYNFPQRLNGDPELLPVLQAQTDVRAALIEAYIAALYFSFSLEDRLTTGIKTIDTWLREMYEPLYDFFYNYMKTEYEQHHSTVGATLDGRVEVQNKAEIARIDNASQGMAILVQMYCSNQDRELRWEEEKYETNVGSLWKIQCTVDGIELGEGVRPFKKAAKNVAGWEAAKKLGLTDEA